jgi:hypothetical protein
MAILFNKLLRPIYRVTHPAVLSVVALITMVLFIIGTIVQQPKLQNTFNGKALLYDNQPPPILSTSDDSLVELQCPDTSLDADDVDGKQYSISDDGGEILNILHGSIDTISSNKDGIGYDEDRLHLGTTDR